MHIGVCMFATDYAIRIDELARAAEERGFESLWVPEHTHIPKSRKTPFAGGEPLPKEYYHTLDPFVSLMAAAAVTKKLRVGTGICLVIERDPITTAKEVASLDLLSGGRFELGIGAGWNQDEMENHGTVYKARYPILREKTLAMKEIWTKEEAQFHGDYVQLRSDLLLPEARAEAAPARAPGRRDRPHPAARGRLLRRLVPAGPQPRGRHHRPGRPEGPGGQGRARHEDDHRLRLRRQARRGRARPVRRRRESRAPSSGCPRRGATRSCPCSTSSPS